MVLTPPVRALPVSTALSEKPVFKVTNTRLPLLDEDWPRFLVNDTRPFMKEKLNDLIEWTFHRDDSLFLACNVRNAFSTSEVHKNYTLWTCQKVCEALTFYLTIFI